MVGFVVVSISMLAGVALGSISGFYSGAIDNVFMRIVDILLAIPPILLAIAIAAALRPGLASVIIAVGIGAIPGYARIVRASALSLREQEFVEAARSVGASDIRIMLRHVLPNCMAPVIVQATMGMAGAISAAAGLSFIGLGLQPPSPEWGAMLSDGRRFMLSGFWHMTLFPGLAIALIIFGLNMMGDGLRDAFDPKLKSAGFSRRKFERLKKLAVNSEFNSEQNLEGGSTAEIAKHGDNLANLLDIKNLSIRYVLDEGTVRAVNNLNFSLKPGQTIGLVGETGAGKTTTALGIMRLLQSPPGMVAGGEIIFESRNLLDLSESEMRKVRGRKISMIFQDPMTSLNPVMPVRDQVAEVILLHEKLSAKAALKKAEEMLDKVGIRPERAREFPHQFSGGMRQRVIIAIALACNPALLIADEPTTALDVTIQAQVLELMKKIKAEVNTSMIMISHDLGVVADICDKVAIMYAGSIVELADKNELFKNPKHPYTIGLFNSIPDIEKDAEYLVPIKGSMPDPMNLPSGCPFHPRCSNADGRCVRHTPRQIDVGADHFVKCLLYEAVK